ncbi:MAG: hypothetical protein AABZ39_08730 [Spirochaetota bacterium]
MKQRTGVVFLGIVFVVIGGVILAGNTAGIPVARLWPLFILALAIWFSIIAFTVEGSRGILMPATILTVLAAYFLWLNFTSWTNAAWTWPIYIAAPGVGLLVMSFFTREKTFIPALILIGIAGACYGFFIARSHIAVPAVLIGLGVLILIQAFMPKRVKD